MVNQDNDNENSAQIDDPEMVNQDENSQEIGS
jgi:hypothetical protein